MNGIPNESGINDCYWNIDGRCTSFKVTRDINYQNKKPSFSRDWDSRQNCTLTQFGAPICGEYLQEGRVK